MCVCGCVGVGVCVCVCEGVFVCVFICLLLNCDSMMRFGSMILNELNQIS